MKKPLLNNSLTGRGCDASVVTLAFHEALECCGPIGKSTSSGRHRMAVETYRVGRFRRAALLMAAVCISLAAAVWGAEQRVPVWPGAEAPTGDGGTTAATTSLTLYPSGQDHGPAMIICPGGGYGGLVTDAEGHGIARWLAKHGINGLVLEYRLPQGRPMVPLLDVQRAIRLARSNAGAWRIDPDRLGVMGFSAGGHLAAMAATRSDSGKGADETSDPVERFSSRPDVAVLIYPVITMGDGTHAGSRDNLLGGNPGRKRVEEFSAERQVTGDTPPIFLAHAVDDTLVPVANSRLFAKAVGRNGVDVKLMELESGGHGLNGYQGPAWNAWQEACIEWVGEKFPTEPDASRTQDESRLISATHPRVLEGLSPLNWILTKGSIHSSVCGASFKATFLKTRRVTLHVDASGLSYSSPSRFPLIGWTVNDGPTLTHQLAAGETSVVLSDGVPNPRIDFFIKGLSPFEDRFQGEVPPNAVTITGFSAAPGCEVSPPARKPIWLNIGDSILSGDAAAYAREQGRPADDLWASAGDARASYGYLLARHFGYTESRLAFGGYAWTGGLANNPPFEDLVDSITSTTSRLSGGKLTPAPGVVLVNLGENGTTPSGRVVDALGKLRARCSPDTRVIVMVPVSGK